MELDILTLSQQMKSSFMLACTFHMQKNIVRISFISTSNGNKPAKKEILPPFFSTTSINERRNFIWEAKKKKNFHTKNAFFSVFGIEMKNEKKTEMLSGTNSITIITPPWVVPHNTQHTGLGTKKVWGDTHPLNTKSQISSWLFICTYVCTYLDMKNLIKYFLFYFLFSVYLSHLQSEKNSAWFRKMITEQFEFSVWRNFFHFIFFFV